MEKLFPRGRVVWAKMRGHCWWPGIIIDGNDVGRSKKKGNMYHLIYWLGEHSVSEISIKRIRDFIDDYHLRDDTKARKSYKLALFEAVQEMSLRLHKSISNSPHELIEWANKSFWPRYGSIHSTIISHQTLFMIDYVKQDLVKYKNKRKRRSSAATSGPSNKVFVCQDPLSNEDDMSDQTDSLEYSEDDGHYDDDYSDEEDDGHYDEYYSDEEDGHYEEDDAHYEDSDDEHDSILDIQHSFHHTNGKQWTCASYEADSPIARHLICWVKVVPYFSEGRIVWAKRNKIWWPAVIINMDDQKCYGEDGLQICLIYNFGNHKISQISVSALRDFIENFQLHDEEKRKKRYKLGILEALKEICERFDKTDVYDNIDKKLEWARNSFFPRNNSQKKCKMTSDLLLKIAQIKKSQVNMANAPAESTSCSGPLLNEKMTSDLLLKIAQIKESQVTVANAPKKKTSYSRPLLNEKMTSDLLLKIAQIKESHVTVANAPKKKTSYSRPLLNENTASTSDPSNKVLVRQSPLSNKKREAEMEQLNSHHEKDSMAGKLSDRLPKKWNNTTCLKLDDFFIERKKDTASTSDPSNKVLVRQSPLSNKKLEAEMEQLISHHEKDLMAVKLSDCIPKEWNNTTCLNSYDLTNGEREVESDDDDIFEEIIVVEEAVFVEQDIFMGDPVYAKNVHLNTIDVNLTSCGRG